LVYLGVLLFAMLFQFYGYNRHSGILFLAFVACLWRTRRYAPSFAKGLFLWYAILILSATSGIATLSSELQTFANGRNVATWLKNNNLENEFIVGYHDVGLVTVAGYLERPIYYLKCESSENMRVNGCRNQRRDSTNYLVDSLGRAVDKAANRQVILILTGPTHGEGKFP